MIHKSNPFSHPKRYEADDNWVEASATCPRFDQDAIRQRGQDGVLLAEILKLKSRRECDMENSTHVSRWDNWPIQYGVRIQKEKGNSS